MKQTRHAQQRWNRNNKARPGTEAGRSGQTGRHTAATGDQSSRAQRQGGKAGRRSKPAGCGYGRRGCRKEGSRVGRQQRHTGASWHAGSRHTRHQPHPHQPEAADVALRHGADSRAVQSEKLVARHPCVSEGRCKPHRQHAGNEEAPSSHAHEQKGSGL